MVLIINVDPLESLNTKVSNNLVFVSIKFAMHKSEMTF